MKTRYALLALSLVLLAQAFAGCAAGQQAVQPAAAGASAGPIPTITNTITYMTESPVPLPAATPSPFSGPTPTAEPTPTPIPTITPTLPPAPTPSPSPKPQGKTKVAYLTFDDGPSPKGDSPEQNTEKLLDLLKQHGIKATFFLIGGSVNAYPKLARRVAKEGHCIGNHTWSHADAEKTPAGNFEWQVRHTNDVIETVTGIRPTLFRPPYGRHLSQAQWGALGKNKMRAVWWDIDTMDWNRGVTDGKSLRQVIYGIQTGKDLVILYHDHSFRMLEEAIALLEKDGYTFDTLDRQKSK